MENTSTPLTRGQRLVGISFNHAQGQTHDEVHTCKQSHADLIDTLDAKLNTSDGHPSPDKHMLLEEAIKLQIAAQMAAVKALTYRD